MNIKIPTASFLALVLMTSCVNLDKIFTTDYDTATLKIPASIDSIDFHDRRSRVSPGDIPLPVFSSPNQLIVHYPELNPAHKRLVFDLVNRNFTPGAIRVYHADIEVIEGFKEFSATFSSETEKVRIGLRITLSNEHEQIATEAWGEYFVSSADAKYKRFEELYQRTLQTVAHAALKELKSKYFTQYSSSAKDVK